MPTIDDDRRVLSFGEIVDAIRARQRFVISSHARPDGDSIGSAARRWRTRCARSARRSTVVNADPAPPPLMQFPGVPDIAIADRVDGDFDAAIIMECSDLARTGVAGLDRFFVINIDHHPGQHRLRPDQLVRRDGGRLRRDGLRPGPRARRAADARDRDAHLPRHPDRHRLVSLLEHLAAHLRHLPRDARSRRRSGAGRAERVRQQQHGPAEAVRRGAERDADRSRPAASRSSTSITRWRARPAAPTKTPKA